MSHQTVGVDVDAYPRMTEKTKLPPDAGRALARMRYWVAGHAVDDFYQGLVPAALPFFAIERGYSYTAIASLAMAATLGSALPQPIFGLVADRRSISWIAPLGLSTAGVAACLAVTAPHYAAVWTLFLASGLGVAAFHPAAGRDARRDAGASTTAMSYFASGGKIGFFLAPVVVTPLAAHLGLRSLLPLAIPALVMGALLLRYQVRTNRSAQIASKTVIGRDRWAPFLTLTGVEITRSTVSFGINTFIALYFIKHFGTTATTGGVALSLFLAGGIMGTVVGGIIADQCGTVRTVQIGGALIIPFLIALHLSTHPTLALALTFAAGAAINIPFAVMIKLGQDYLPNRLGTAAGVTLGLAVSAGGVFMPILGALADAHGVTSALTALCALAVLPVGLSLLLPTPND